MPLPETESLSAGRLPLVLFPDGTRLEGVFYEPRGAEALRYLREPVELFAAVRTGEASERHFPVDPVAGWQ